MTDSQLRKYLREQGVEEKAIDEYLLGQQSTERALDERVCPKCRKDLTRRIDPRQIGSSSMPGQWVMYRCTCGFMCDRKECDA